MSTALLRKRVLFFSFITIVTLFAQSATALGADTSVFSRRHWRSGWDGLGWLDDESFLARYNRVEGLFLGLRVPSSLFRSRYTHNLSLSGHVGYGFKSEQWRYRVALERWLFDEFRMTFGMEAHDLTDTQDSWIIPTYENNLAAFLLHEDFQDFYRREGWSLYASQNFGYDLKLSFGYHYDSFFSMQNKNDWALFGGDKHFRANPAIDEGVIRSWSGSIALDTRDYPESPERGWNVTVMAEIAGRDLKSDYSFDRLLVDIRRYQPVGWFQNIDIRVRAGSAIGVLPLQYVFDLGGLSTLRGYRFKAFSGDRMFLVNLEYRLYGGKTPLPEIFCLRHLSFILFVDSGIAWHARDNSHLMREFDDFTWSDLKTNVGIAISDRYGRVRLNFAKRTDISTKPMVITLRLNRAF